MISFIRESRDSAPRGSPAIHAPGKEFMTYDALLDQVEQFSNFLTANGLGRGDKIAMVLPEGPCVATAFLGVANVAVAAPLNPGYRNAEFEECFSRLGAKALLVSAGRDSVAREVASGMKMAIFEILPDVGTAGLFSSRTVQKGGSGDFRASDPEICLASFTSGTADRPKIVPLTRTNVCTSARNIARTLRLSSTDRCLNVMPLFHLHGLIASVLAPIASGGSVVCSSGARFPDFFEWLSVFKPTWYTAAPAIHQAILANAPAKSLAGSLRFVRSASSPLHPTTMAELGRLFQAPVVECYGMTEAANQIASNPLPPARQKPGSVGPPDGPEVAILGERGEPLEPGKTGEIFIRGPTVTSGYENDAAANEKAFLRGWLRTGDLGYLDSDGYLFLAGRIKELINRGGEKIAPREVDEALLGHVAVAEAVAFAMPHPTLGEEICAAVTLNKGISASEVELREYLRGRLAEFKVPKRLVFVDEIPKNATGKIQRAGLYETLKDRLTAPTCDPRSEFEMRITAIWKSVLKREQVGIHDNFFSLGGDSLRALTVIAKAREAGIFIDPALSFKEPTVAGMASIAEARSQEMNPSPTSHPGESWWQQLTKNL